MLDEELNEDENKTIQEQLSRFNMRRESVDTEIKEKPVKA